MQLNANVAILETLNGDRGNLTQNFMSQIHYVLGPRNTSSCPLSYQRTCWTDTKGELDDSMFRLLVIIQS